MCEVIKFPGIAPPKPGEHIIDRPRIARRLIEMAIKQYLDCDMKDAAAWLECAAYQIDADGVLPPLLLPPAS